jgi:HD superfamily phosphodiesterase
MKLKNSIEKSLIKTIREYFGECYIYNHTLGAVYWMKELIKKEGGDERILLPAIYLHDIGYPDSLGNKKNNYMNHKAAKSMHMEVGASISKKILIDLKFDPTEIDEICHLISVHDTKIIETFNEQMVFEADSLSMIDRTRINPDFSKEDYQIFLESFKKTRLPLFKTKHGKESLIKLWPVAKGYFK